MVAPYEGEFFTPDIVRAEIDSVDTHIRMLVKRAIENDANLAESTRRGFADFVIGWHRFREAHTDTLTLAMNSTRQAVADWRNRTISWQTTLETEGVKPVAVMPVVNTSGKPAWKQALFWASAGIGAFILYRGITK